MDHGKAIKHCTLGKNTGKRVGGFVDVGGGCVGEGQRKHQAIIGTQCIAPISARLSCLITDPGLQPRQCTSKSVVPLQEFLLNIQQTGDAGGKHSTSLCAAINRSCEARTERVIVSLVTPLGI